MPHALDILGYLCLKLDMPKEVWHRDEVRLGGRSGEGVLLGKTALALLPSVLAAWEVAP